MNKNQPESRDQDSNLVHISSETNDLGEQSMTGEDEQLIVETKALVEAIRKRAQAEIENAQTIYPGCLSQCYSRC